MRKARLIEQEHCRNLVKAADHCRWGPALIHIGNEAAGRSKVAQAILVGMGLRAGIPDYFLALPNKEVAGHWIEMKAPDEKPSAQQHEYLHYLREKGYAAVWFDHWTPAFAYCQQAYKRYLDEKLVEPLHAG